MFHILNEVSLFWPMEIWVNPSFILDLAIFNLQFCGNLVFHSNCLLMTLWNFSAYVCRLAFRQRLTRTPCDFLELILSIVPSFPVLTSANSSHLGLSKVQFLSHQLTQNIDPSLGSSSLHRPQIASKCEARAVGGLT